MKLFKFYFTAVKSVHFPTYIVKMKSSESFFSLSRAWIPEYGRFESI